MEKPTQCVEESCKKRVLNLGQLMPECRRTRNADVKHNNNNNYYHYYYWEKVLLKSF